MELDPSGMRIERRRQMHDAKDAWRMQVVGRGAGRGHSRADRMRGRGQGTGDEAAVGGVQYPSRTTASPAGPPIAQDSKLKRHRDLYGRIAAQLVRDGLFELATNGGPMGLWFERFEDGSAAFGYLACGSSGRGRIGKPERELIEIAMDIEWALLNSRVHPLVLQPSLDDQA
jgi:hypothetical protein